MKLQTQAVPQEASDADLVARCRRGERDAFGWVVARYQSLICAIAFSACGSVAQSEDIAQEVFVSAWRQIGRLREPAKLKEWLCGIARQTAVQVYRRERREPVYRAHELAEDTAGIELQPSEQAFRREEEAILWRAMEGLDESFREALVLYYRQHLSIEHVAAALDLSEEAVRQRLSRGRKALQQEVLKMLEGTLIKSGPGPAFRSSVMGALPVAAAGNVAAASALKGGMALKGATLLGALLGNLAGPLVGMSAQLYAAESRTERRWVLRNWMKLLGATALYIAAVYSIRFLRIGNLGWLLAVLGLVTAIYLVVLGAFIRDWTQGWESRFAKPFCGSLGIRAFEYRSRVKFLGLPLVHIRSGPGRDGLRHPAKGWIAVARTAYGGGAALAQHANDPEARAAIRALLFFRHRQALFTVFIICSWLPMVGVSLYRRWLKDRVS